MPAQAGPSGLGSGIDALIAQTQAAKAGQTQTPYGGGGTNPLASAYAGGATPQQIAGIASQMSPTLYGGQPNSMYSNMIGRTVAGANAQPAAAPAAASAAMGPSGLTRQQYLSLLAHPGPVPTFGAAGPQAGQTPTGSPPPNVLQSFLSANSGKGGSFLNTLRGLQQPGATS